MAVLENVQRLASRFRENDDAILLGQGLFDQLAIDRRVVGNEYGEAVHAILKGTTG